MNILSLLKRWQGGEVWKLCNRKHRLRSRYHRELALGSRICLSENNVKLVLHPIIVLLLLVLLKANFQTSNKKRMEDIFILGGVQRRKKVWQFPKLFWPWKVSWGLKHWKHVHTSYRRKFLDLPTVYFLPLYDKKDWKVEMISDQNSFYFSLWHLYLCLHPSLL